LALVVEQEFLRVQQRPHDVFEGSFGFSLVFLDVGDSDGRFIRRRFAGEREQVQLADLHFRWLAGVASEYRSAAGTGGQLALDLTRIE